MNAAQNARRFFLGLELTMILRTLLSLLAMTSFFGASQAAVAHDPVNFLFADSDDLATRPALIERPDIAGVQIVYTWKSLEPAQGEYDFSQIETDLAFLEKRGKKLFVQLQDRFFLIEARNVPRYLLEGPEYGGGLVPQSDNPGEGKPVGHGWVAMQWNPAVRARFQALLRALATKFDGRIHGINLPESAVEVDPKKDKTGFTCDVYFAAEMENARVARAAFRKSHVVQYVNFWPCEWENERKYMSRFFEFAAQNHIGLGGPDIVPWQPAQMKNSYPFFNQYLGRLELVAMAVQEPTLTYTNPKTKQKFTRAEFVAFARDYLGVDIIFWSVGAPWMKAD
jgi:hypothetical protein